ncbi:MAG TPA: alpha/beta hydrolase [Chitinophagaceae bacterium]|nr:alpha/beta hydrolase [Chitinophagaceae bacterium]
MNKSSLFIVKDPGMPLLHFKNSFINYYRYGNGPKQLVCFHGYAEEAKAFGFLEKYIGGQYTLYSIDLPFHGKTDWKEGLDLSTSDLAHIVEEITNIKSDVLRAPGSRLSLMGFSLGGRMALGLYQSMPARVDQLILLAPDGLKVNFWYWLSTQTRLGNKFFSFTMKRPGWFFRFLKLLNKLRLVNTSIFKFVNFYIGNKEVRELLYARWTTLRKIKPGIKKIKSAILQHGTPVQLIYGKYDRIILSSVGEKFKKGIEDHCSLSVIASGHQVLHERHAEDIKRSLIV